MAEWTKCCRGRRSNCPQISIEGKTLHIRDDFGNEVQMSLEDFQAVKWRVDEAVMQRTPTREGIYFHGGE
jgi:hypothetical protein